jgi:hypothetical protein
MKTGERRGKGRQNPPHSPFNKGDEIPGNKNIFKSGFQLSLE